MKKVIVTGLCVSILLILPYLSNAYTPHVPNGNPGDDDGPYLGGLDDPTDRDNFFGL